jgi:hypothetical protein
MKLSKVKLIPMDILQYNMEIGPIFNKLPKEDKIQIIEYTRRKTIEYFDLNHTEVQKWIKEYFQDNKFLYDVQHQYEFSAYYENYNAESQKIIADTMKKLKFI